MMPCRPIQDFAKVIGRMCSQAKWSVLLTLLWGATTDWNLAAQDAADTGNQTPHFDPANLKAEAVLWTRVFGTAGT